MNISNKKVLVTGGGGFIGSHLVEDLIRYGAEVTVFLKYNSKGDQEFIEEFSDEIRKKIKIITGDLRDSDTVRMACKGQEIIFHLGALIAIPYSYQSPRDFIDTNITGTLNVLMGAKEYGIERFVHTSTSEVYGTARYIPIDEKHPLQGQSPYSATKISADKLVESFHLTYGLPTIIVRPFNTYGPRQSARAVIPTIISQALNSNAIKIGSLTPKRDFNFVKDTVDGFIKAANSDIVGEVINIGSGKHITIGELINIIKKVMNKDFEVIIDESRIRPEKSEVLELISDNSLAKELIGYEPKTHFIEGLHETVEYIKKYLSNYKTKIYNI